MFSILVKIDGFLSRRRNAALLHVVLGFFLILKVFDWYSYSAYSNLLPMTPILIVAGLSLYYGFFRRKFDPSGKQNLWLRLVQATTFFVFAFVMLRVGHPVDYYGLFIWTALTLILMLTERRIFDDTVVYLDENGVRIPGYFKDHMVAWEKLENVVVRHDFVTFFHRNNKYLQFQVMQTLSELEVAKMNAFCKEKLEREETSNIKSSQS